MCLFHIFFLNFCFFRCCRSRIYVLRTNFIMKTYISKKRQEKWIFFLSNNMIHWNESLRSFGIRLFLNSNPHWCAEYVENSCFIKFKRWRQMEMLSHKFFMYYNLIIITLASYDFALYISMSNEHYFNYHMNFGINSVANCYMTNGNYNLFRMV